VTIGKNITSIICFELNLSWRLLNFAHHAHNIIDLSAQDFILSSVGSDKLLSIIIEPIGADTDFEACLCIAQIRLPVFLQ